MLTISQLATHAGVTVRAVRHYHQVGLLPEPERDHSGYRRYDAEAVVRLIRIRTLADAGVPLARVPELLDASPEVLTGAVAEIDARLRAEIRQLQRHRQDLARLTGGDSLALPQAAVDYLQMLRDEGVPDAMVATERDAWILIAARWPEHMTAWISDKVATFEDPRVMQLYRLLDPSMDPDDPRLGAAADLLVAFAEEAVAAGQTDDVMDQADVPFVELLDSLADAYGPLAGRLQELLAERGWSGWAQLAPTRT